MEIGEVVRTPVEMNMGSRKTIALVRAWLEACMEAHEACISGWNPKMEADSIIGARLHRWSVEGTSSGTVLTCGSALHDVELWLGFIEQPTADSDTRHPWRVKRGSHDPNLTANLPGCCQTHTAAGWTVYMNRLPVYSAGRRRRLETRSIGDGQSLPEQLAQYICNLG
jgi:hypothetical protein